MIELEDVSHSHGGAALLSNVSPGLEPGLFHFLTGPSAAGKSTRIRLCHAGLRPTRGRVRLLSMDPSVMDRDAVARTRQRIGVVHQDGQVRDPLPVAEDVGLPVPVAGRDVAAEADNLPAVLAWVGLRAQAEALRSQLSGGERQRAAMARAVILSPDVIPDNEWHALLEPWFSPDPPLDSLPLPRLVEIVETEAGMDAEALRLRLAGEAPGALLDDHTRWAGLLGLLGWLSVGLIGAVMAAMIALSASAALAATSRGIEVLRLVGARDTFIARAFVRRFSPTALTGAAIGTLAGMVAVALLPRADAVVGVFSGLGLRGADWLWPLVPPPVAAAVALAATRARAIPVLKGIT